MNIWHKRTFLFHLLPHEPVADAQTLCVHLNDGVVKSSGHKDDIRKASPWHEQPIYALKDGVFLQIDGHKQHIQTASVFHVRIQYAALSDHFA